MLAASLDDTCTRLVTASADAAVRVWDVTSAETSNILQLHDEPVVYSRFGPRGEILVTASEDGTAIILDTNSGTPRKVIDGYKGGVVRAILNSKIEHHLTYDYDGKPRIVESPSEIRSSKWYANLEQIVADARELPFQCLNLDQRRRYGLPSTPQFTKNPDTYCKQNN